MNIDHFLNPTFMVGVAFLLLCIMLAKPGWNMLIAKLEEHRQEVSLEFQKIDQILKEAQDRLEYAEVILERFETKKESFLQHIEQHSIQLEKTFQKELSNKETWENARFHTQCDTLLKAWKKEANQRFMKELNIHLGTLLHQDMVRYAKLNNSVFSQFLKERSS
ncbi:hypothetical protein [Holospora curviuscula]|uniref:ATP synthase subunit b n=1 Tax=Holospora curviuscula TaxID=1082868 RepID=A0A2S5R7U4_9PROT|nr:hypothetical protein [Holospora curviuscula]PPE03357.1 ATP synthase subunit b [Holospora curviuscula]